MLSNIDTVLWPQGSTLDITEGFVFFYNSAALRRLTVSNVNGEYVLTRWLDDCNRYYYVCYYWLVFYDSFWIFSASVQKA